MRRAVAVSENRSGRADDPADGGVGVAFLAAFPFDEDGDADDLPAELDAAQHHLVLGGDVIEGVNNPLTRVQATLTRHDWPVVLEPNTVGWRGFAGAFIPIVLERRGVDPAVASSIFVTTFTDVCGFFLLLWLAGNLLL